MYLLLWSKYFSQFLIHDITGFVLYVELYGLTQCTFAHCLLFRGGASSYLLVIYMLYSIQSCLHLVCVSFDHSCMNLLKKTLWNETHWKIICRYFKNCTFWYDYLILHIEIKKTILKWNTGFCCQFLHLQC